MSCPWGSGALLGRLGDGRSLAMGFPFLVTATSMPFQPESSISMALSCLERSMLHRSANTHAQSVVSES